MKSSHEKPEYSLIISPEAQADVVDILQFTLEEWGLQQAEKYQGVLDNAFSTIHHNPHLGHRRPDIQAEYRAFQAGQHIIVFRTEKKTVYVVRVLHSCMDFSRHISGTG
jgi:toxin ParE1/3/4